MALISSVLRKVEGGYMHWCPACKGHHMIAVDEPFPNGARWAFDGNVEKPTFSPSVKVQWTYGEQQEKRCCHYHISAGKIQFCRDCTHEFAGKTVNLPDLTEGHE